jgi:NAD(P)-dependent dehydrogenase (short-subunit alcohol dehydrogenase family)
MRVFITAGASGLGRAFAEAFLDQGAQVAIIDRDPQALATFTAAHPTVTALPADVTDEANLAAMMAQAKQALGGFDVICANAGTGGPAGPLETLEAQAWRDCVDVNLTGAFLTAKHAIPTLKDQGSGLILFTTSTAGQWGYPNRSPYSSAKWALVGLTKGLAMELGGHGIRVNAIAPGSVEGDRMERVLTMEAAARNIDPETVRAEYVQGVSMKTWVSAEDIAATATFLASPAARRISGQVIAVDGNTETLR